ncbi:MAG: metal-sensitive transcriptional regulator [Dethiobacteria bacterium]|jgi:DNA-binding FrmR family transcriptional regulator
MSAENKSYSYKRNRKEIMDSLKRIEGQVRGIQKMVDERRYCVDVLTQIAAARMALARVALIILEDHTLGCVCRAIVEEEHKHEAVEELLDVIKKFIR